MASIKLNTPSGGSLTLQPQDTLNNVTLQLTTGGDGVLLQSGEIGVTIQPYDADLTNWAGKTAPTGDAVGTTDTQTLTNKDINGNNNTVSNISLTTSVTGTLPVTSGGSGATTLTGILKGNGTSAFSAATVGTDYVAPGTSSTFTALQTFSGTSSVSAIKFNNAKEPCTVSATAATGTINYDITTQSVLYYTTNASGNWTLNLRASSGTTLNNLMNIGECITVTFLATQGSTAYYNNSIQVDGTTSGVTTKWQGGSAPTSGNTSSIDIYGYTIIKTAASTFTVLVSQTKFA